MSDPVLSAVLTQLFSILESQIRQELRLVTGVDKDIKNLENTLRAIDAVMVDAEKKQVTEKNVNLWLQRLQEAVYDMDDVLNEWSTALLKIEIEGLENSTTRQKKVRSFLSLPCFCVSRVASRRDIAIKVKRINGELDAIARDKDRYKFNSDARGEGYQIPQSTIFGDVTEVRGRDGDKTTLVAKLLKDTSQENRRPLHTISIVGMGGIGKTTLAQLAYHCDQVKDNFPTRIWVCVSEPFDDMRVAKAIVEFLDGEAPNLSELQTVLSRLSDRIRDKKFLLVLDDVWMDDYRRWEPLIMALSSGAPGSKVLVTTRNKGVAQTLRSSYTLFLGELNEQDCWSLFHQIAFFNRSLKDCEELENIGKRIAKKCKGLPLAAQIMGSLMASRSSVQDWKNVLDSDMWNLEAQKGIFPPLLLSYHCLPPPVKRCFSYCANFPQDYEMEADNLIKLWMAQGYLSSNGNLEMEATGRDYLDTLVMRSFFQIKKDKDKGRDNVTRYKMHDMVLELAQYLRSESHVMEVHSGLEAQINSSCARARHLTLIRSEDAPFPKSIGNIEKLHTFWVQSFYDSPPIVSEVDRILPELFDQLVHLKALDLSRNRLCELPKEIQKMMNLRYLNLSHNPFWELPETVCGLYNLQTLKLVACDHLRRVPQGIGKLRNLRHLEIDRTANLKTLPKGIGKLLSLQTLTKFVLAGTTDGEETICRIGDLNSLNQLRGCLKIEGLGYVANADEAEKAELKNKKHLADVHLDFSPQIQAGGRTDVADALQLHPDLQSLHISFYGGSHLPSWITSLTNLRKLGLQDCPSCTSLPPLGRLPSLENLYLDNMHGLKLIGSELFGGSNVNHSTQTYPAAAAASLPAVILFPKLKKLKFSRLSSWEEWQVTSKEGGSEKGNLSVMPYLRYLKLSDCSKLKALPDILLQKTSLRKLYIQNCPLLQQQYNKKTGVHRMKVYHIPIVRIP